MKDRISTPVIIGIIIAVAAAVMGTAYATVTAFIPGGAVIRIVIGVALTAFLTALVVVVIRRIREIREEDEDDYRKY